MLIENATTSFIGARRVAVAWTGTAGLAVWIMLNGRVADGPLTFEDTARSVELDITEPFNIEIHECAEGETPEPLSPLLTRRPTLWWSPRTGARSYQAYRKASAVATETLLGSVGHDDSGHFEFQAKTDLRGAGGQWNFFRVEAVNGRGRETVRTAWPFHIPGLPPPPVAITPSGAAGVFSFALELA